jgi:hypothetical protein
MMISRSRVADTVLLGRTHHAPRDVFLTAEREEYGVGPPNARRGIALIELMITMTAGTVLLGIACSLLYGVLEIDRGAREQVQTTAVVGRLAEQFRHDVHEAVRVEADGTKRQVLELRLAGGAVVTYRLEPGRIVRGEQAQGAARREECFMLPQESAAVVELRKPSAVSLASLQIRSPRIAGVNVSIDAAVGKEVQAEGKRR